MLAAEFSGIPVIAVRENGSILNVTAEKMGMGGVVEVNSYLEAARLVMAMRKGISMGEFGEADRWGAAGGGDAVGRFDRVIAGRFDADCSGRLILSVSPTFSRFEPSGNVQDVVSGDVACRHCSYNLNHAPLLGLCPECGTPVALSVQGDRLCNSDPKWLGKLARGINLILWEIVVVIFGLAGVVVLFRHNLWVSGIVGLIGRMVGLAGTWMVTEPDPSGVGEDAYGSIRKWIRVIAIAEFSHQFLQLYINTSAGYWQRLLLIQIIAMLFEIVSLAGTMARLKYFQKLALRIPDDRLAARSRLLFWGLGLCSGAMMVCRWLMRRWTGPGTRLGATLVAFMIVLVVVGIAVLVFAILYFIMLVRLKKVLGKQADIARQTWAKVSAIAP